MYLIFYEPLFVIGCYEESAVNTGTKKSYEMYFPSAGLCQEVCFASSYSVFGVQVTLLVCQLVFTYENVIFYSFSKMEQNNLNVYAVK